tara:strand:- start:5082 stop:5942 length:861 start_codon:yes stop_codon:yes gene_type:complete
MSRKLDIGEYHPGEYELGESIKISKTLTGKKLKKRFIKTFYKKPLSGRATLERKQKRRIKLGLKSDVKMNESLLKKGGLKKWRNNALSKNKITNEEFIVKKLLDKKFLPKDTTILPMSGDEPAFARWLWGAKQEFIEANNCYAYSTNQFRFYRKMKAQPGGNRKFVKDGEYVNTYINCSSLVDNVIRDAGNGAYALKDANKKCKRGTYKIMLFISPSEEYKDFHFFRQDKDGTWSHKQGWGYGPSKLDASGKIIFNPIKSNLNFKPYNYSKYCSSICVPKQFKYNI